MLSVLAWTSILAIGALVLVKGADWLVEGGGRAALHLGVPSIVIGLTLFSLGSTLPELASSLAAVGRGRLGIPVGNVVGSNIANILLVLGASALVKPIKIGEDMFKREMPMIMGAVVLMMLFSRAGAVYRWEGVVLISVYIAYLSYLIWSSLNSPDRVVLLEDKPQKGMRKDLLTIIIGILGVIIGAEMMILSAEFYIVEFGLSEGLVGLSIIALGTSLPELTTGIFASRKGKGRLSLGNVIGASYCNILLVLGVCSLITPITFSSDMYPSVLIMVLSIALVGIFAYTGKVISRLEGSIMVILYIVYIIYLYGPI